MKISGTAILESFESFRRPTLHGSQKIRLPAKIFCGWTSADVIFWRMHYLVWVGDPGERRTEAKRRFRGKRLPGI